ncbi:MAG TPA: DUF4331 family protein [Flavobacterium sp.]|nr:DUF4331 family protein [Flavobacterium sp.]
MKTSKYILGFSVVLFGLLTSCDSDNDDNGPDFSGTYVQKDQMARPAINTVFIASGTPKDDFNMTIPSMMGASYQATFQSRLLALNAGYTTNALGQTAAQFTGLLATDVLGVSKTGTTTFFDGTNVLTGRALADDVIDVELLLIFGGPTGGSNPGLTTDNVDANDKTFSASFPYLAAAW